MTLHKNFNKINATFLQIFSAFLRVDDIEKSLQKEKFYTTKYFKNLFESYGLDIGYNISPDTFHNWLKWCVKRNIFGKRNYKGQTVYKINSDFLYYIKLFSNKK